MSAYIEIKIAVTPVVKAFLRKKFAIEPYFELSQDNKFGIFLYNCLAKRKNPRICRPSVKKPKPAEKTPNINIYTETLTVRVTEETWRRCGHYISPLKQIGFNRLVQFDINESFYLWVDCCVSINGMTLHKSFFSFREKFELDEDNLTLKNMEKKYERYRSRLSA